LTMAESNQQPVLTSLRMYDEIRSNATSVTREEGSNVDLLTTPDGEGTYALCHLSALLPFTFGDSVPFEPAFEDAAAIALAAHHLNVGDGRIVPQVQRLNERCNVRFTAEFADTEFQGGVTLSHIVQQTNREPGASERIPCAFIGAYGSRVSIPMSIVTGLLGYPQVSGASTSAALDDVSQYPLFARTIPSDAGNAIPLIIFMRNVLDITHLAVVNVNDAYGNSYVEGLRAAAEEYAPDMIIHQIPLDAGEGAIESAVTSLKNTKCRFVYGLVFTIETHDALMTEAFRQGVAGNGDHNWLFGDSFFDTLDGRSFEKGSPLHLSYQGVGLFEVTGGIGGMSSYDNYSSAVAELRNSEDLEYLGSLFPKHDYRDYGSDPPFIDNEDFLTPPLKSAFSSFMYEATIALGLAACDASSDTVSFSGQDHYDYLVNTSFTGVGGIVSFHQDTGSRDPSSALYKVQNYIGKEDIDPTTGQAVVQFKPAVTDLFQEGDWNQLQDYIFNDGTANLPPDLPPPETGKDLNLGLAIGLPVASVVILGLIIFLFYENKRKQNDSVWKVEREELKFCDPPEIIGRGTFGLVLLAEYRGTQVAVKRVIPPNTTRKKGKKKDAMESGSLGTASDSETDNAKAMTRVASGGNIRGVQSVGSSNGSVSDPSSNVGKTSGTVPGSGASYNIGIPASVGTSFGTTSRSAQVVRSGVGYGVGFSSGTGLAWMTRRNEATNWTRLKQEFIEEMRYLSKLRHPCVTTVMGESLHLVKPTER
jgi:hypothetical protein